MFVQVRKRDGSLEDFDRNKIIKVLMASGLAESDATALATDVESWASEVGTDNIISSPELRGKVLGLLNERNPEAARRFEGYQKPV